MALGYAKVRRNDVGIFLRRNGEYWSVAGDIGFDAYRLGKSENGLLEIAKQVDLSTHEQVGGVPRIRSIGGGLLLFNVEEKVPQSCEMTLTNSFESAGATRRVAVKVSWKLLPGEDIERVTSAPAVGDASGSIGAAPIETPNDE